VTQVLLAGITADQVPALGEAYIEQGIGKPGNEIRSLRHERNQNQKKDDDTAY
jgi:hypothetical protein